MNILDMPVVIFALDERTIELCKHSFEKLGFKNIIILNKEIGFSDKMLEFFKLSEVYDNDLFLRTDADRIALPETIDFCKKSIEEYEKIKNFYISEGMGYECFLENVRYRYATPHIYSREVMEYCINNKERMINNIQKPESFIGGFFKTNYNAVHNYELLTNIHEYGQYPSKMYHSFMNRMNRGHATYYNMPKLLSDNTYGKVMKKVLLESNESKKNSMDYANLQKKFEEDDRLLGPITKEGLEEHYNACLSRAVKKVSIK